MAGSRPESGGSRGELELARANVCRLLARVFSAKPTPELLAAMKESGMLESLDSLGVTFDGDFLAGDEREQAEALAVEYTRLFVGPGPHIAPYESVFVRGFGEDGPQLWGSATEAVSVFYREAGLEIRAGNEIPDHIGIELEAAAELAATQAELLERGETAEAERVREQEMRFAREHLAVWLPDFSRAVAGQARESFYRGMAALIAGLVEIYRQDNEGKAD